jgi:hypothetical protein
VEDDVDDVDIDIYDTPPPAPPLQCFGQRSSNKIPSWLWASSAVFVSCARTDADISTISTEDDNMGSDNTDTNSTCIDMPGYADSDGDTCEDWAQNPTWCSGSWEDGVFDPPSMYANAQGIDPSTACCVCRGVGSESPDFCVQVRKRGREGGKDVGKES